MAIGLIGKKCGMTRIFTEDGVSVPVTVIEAQTNRISQLKTLTTDGYNAVQMASGTVKTNRLSKTVAGHFAATKTEPGRNINEFRCEESDVNAFEVGMEIKVDIFEEGQKVDVTGKTIGKGFAGTVKRHNFSMQDATHGNSLSHRAPGSIGQNQTPGRVFKGKKMAGHMGNVRRTIQNLDVIKVDLERNLILVKGAVPGHEGSEVIIKLAVKSKDQKITIKKPVEPKVQESQEVQSEETSTEPKAQESQEVQSEETSTEPEESVKDDDHADSKENT